MNNNRRILKTIKSYKDLNIEDIEKNNIGVEIQDFTNPNLTNMEIEKIVNNYKIKFKNSKCIKSMHGPFIDLKPVSPDDIIRKSSILKYSKAMEIAIELNMDYIIFHSQINPNHIGIDVEEKINEANKIFWNNFIKKFKEYKGIILIENVFEKNPKSIKKLIESINQPNIKINLDIGHANLSNIGLDIWIEELKEYIYYMHIHSNDGEFDLHLPMDKKNIEQLYKNLNKNKINPILSLEYDLLDIKEELKKYRL